MSFFGDYVDRFRKICEKCEFENFDNCQCPEATMVLYRATDSKVKFSNMRVELIERKLKLHQKDIKYIEFLINLKKDIEVDIAKFKQFSELLDCRFRVKYNVDDNTKRTDWFKFKKEFLIKIVKEKTKHKGVMSKTTFTSTLTNNSLSTGQDMSSWDQKV